MITTPERRLEICDALNVRPSVLRRFANTIAKQAQDGGLAYQVTKRELQRQIWLELGRPSPTEIQESLLDLLSVGVDEGLFSLVDVEVRGTHRPLLHFVLPCPIITIRMWGKETIQPRRNR